LQVALVLVKVDSQTGVASWTTNQFYVPPSLEGAGFVGRFLDSIIEHFQSDHGVRELRVTILDADADSQPRIDPASRARRRDLVDFYKSRRFSYDRRINEQTNEFNQLYRSLR
jgi:hypothetical protein